ncbi:hypothetical protein, partial [Ferrimicrobium acidiphilum]|uniref:hypothetical protein n=1 Tax=Ferrimicrobium acidiphilum TaxID=121039 RepID=UPI0023F29574
CNIGPYTSIVCLGAVEIIFLAAFLPGSHLRSDERRQRRALLLQFFLSAPPRSWQSRFANVDVFKSVIRAKSEICRRIAGVGGRHHNLTNPRIVSLKRHHPLRITANEGELLGSII